MTIIRKDIKRYKERGKESTSRQPNNKQIHTPTNMMDIHKRLTVLDDRGQLTYNKGILFYFSNIDTGIFFREKQRQKTPQKWKLGSGWPKKDAGMFITSYT